MKIAHIVVTGMKCHHCEAHVNEEVKKLQGVKSVTSSHEGNYTEVVYEDTLNLEEITKAIASTGYEVGQAEVKDYHKPSLKERLFGK